MKLGIYILGQENQGVNTTLETSQDTIEGLLEFFLSKYTMTKEWKNKPLLIVFEEEDSVISLIGDNQVSKRKKESLRSYAFRMLDTEIKNFNKSANLIYGFSVVYTLQNIGGVGRKISIIFYEPPPFTSKKREDLKSDDYIVSGRLQPAN